MVKFAGAAIGGFVGLILLIVIVGALLGGGRSPKPSPALVWENAKDEVRAHLKDPKSAKFAGFIGQGGPGEMVACGAVNARNSFGGYSGPRRWLVSNKGLLMEELVSSEKFENEWFLNCSTHLRDDLS